MNVYGESNVARFAKKYPASRRALERFLSIVKQPEWPHLSAVKNTFSATDYVSGRLVFDIGGNKYRLIASADYDEQILVIEKVLTHEQYDRERF